MCTVVNNATSVASNAICLEIAQPNHQTNSSTNQLTQSVTRRIRRPTHWILQDGETALYCATVNGRLECVRALLDAGADANAALPRVRGGGKHVSTAASLLVCMQHPVHVGRLRSLRRYTGLR